VAIALVGACGSPNPQVLEDDQIQSKGAARDHGGPSEADKIHRLIDDVRASDAKFMFGDTTMSATEAATDLEYRVTRMSVSTVRQFVEMLTHSTQDRGPPPRVMLPDGVIVDGRDWFLARVQVIEHVDRPAGAIDVQHVAGTPVTLGILDALTIVERSGKRFVAPARSLPNGKTKGKRKEYDAADFGEMLRKKWEFLGADVDDLDTFIGEIASDAFSSMEPYRVIHEDGTEEEFRGWLHARLDARRVAIAKGDAP